MTPVECVFVYLCICISPTSTWRGQVVAAFIPTSLHTGLDFWLALSGWLIS